MLKLIKLFWAKFTAPFRPKVYPKAVADVVVSNHWGHKLNAKVMISLMKKNGDYYHVKFHEFVSFLADSDKYEFRRGFPKILNAKQIEILEPTETELYFLNDK